MVAGLLVTGLALIGLGCAWTSLVPSSMYWGPAQAEELISAQADYHDKTHAHGTDEHNQRQFDAARDRLAKIQNQLDSARLWHDRTGEYIVALGILFILAGIGLHFAAKKRS